jgi:PAS domain S-box-containing protein
MNKLLARQVKKFLGEGATLPEGYAQLMAAVSDAYDHYEMDRQMLDRVMELSSREMVELNQKLRHEIEESRKTSSELEHLFRNIHEVFYSMDMRNFKILQMSDSCVRIYGFTSEELKRDPNLWMGAILEEDQQLIRELYAPMYAGKDLHHTHRIRHRDGSIKWVEIRITTTQGEDGMLDRIDGITIDVTERMEADAKLAQRNEELIKINAELSKTNAELDRFVYSASHELRAPLTSVLGLITVARLQPLDEHCASLLEMMQTSVERLDIFIKDIVNYSRNSRMEIASEKIDFAEVIHDSLEQLRYMPEVQNITITTELKRNDEFFSDRKRITILLNNILSNAIKYHNPQAERPFIHISVEQSAAEATLEVRDNGVGIGEAYLDKIFTMFYRATQLQSGSGLGLYIVKEIVDKMNGHLSVHSQEGKGSTFQFRLPNLNPGKAS